MKNLLISLVFILILAASFMAGCAIGPKVDPNPSIVPSASQTTLITTAPITANPTAIVSTLTPSPTPSPIVTPLPSVVSAGGMGISGLVEANDITPDSTGTTEIPLKNTSQDPIQVSIYYKSPDSTRAGYSNLGDSAKSWVIIEPAEVTVEPNDTEWVKVTLSIPGDVIFPSNQMEFWLTYEFQPGGNLGYQISQRWLLTTKG